MRGNVGSKASSYLGPLSTYRQGDTKHMMGKHNQIDLRNSSDVLQYVIQLGAVGRILSLIAHQLGPRHS